jgi:hypothetical protein
VLRAVTRDVLEEMRRVLGASDVRYSDSSKAC